MRFADLGLRFVIMTVLGALGGWWLDGRLGWRERFPACTIVGFFLGLAAGMVALFRGVSGGSHRGSDRDGAADDRSDR